MDELSALEIVTVSLFIETIGIILAKYTFSKRSYNIFAQVYWKVQSQNMLCTFCHHHASCNIMHHYAPFLASFLCSWFFPLFLFLQLGWLLKE